MQTISACILGTILLAQAPPAAAPSAGGAPQEADARASAAWTQFYLVAAKEYKVTRALDDTALPLQGRAIFDWASISDYNGAVFAWTENGRPAFIGTIFSLPVANSKQRLVLHEGASFSEVELAVTAADGNTWNVPRAAAMRLVPEAAPPPDSANLLKLQCRRLAKDFSAHFNRRGERWDLRLLPTPLVEYRETSKEILGGGLFAFVAFSTDPDILLLIEARKDADGPAWYYQPVRFSDKSLFLKYKDKPVWESLRAAHGPEGTDTDDPQYRQLGSSRLAAEIVEKLSAPVEKE